MYERVRAINVSSVCIKSKCHCAPFLPTRQKPALVFDNRLYLTLSPTQAFWCFIQSVPDTRAEPSQPSHSGTEYQAAGPIEERMRC